MTAVAGDSNVTLEPLDLPTPSDERLDRSPLTLVVCQVRHERMAAAADPRRALEVHAHVTDWFPNVSENPVATLNVVAGPTGVKTAPSELQRGWRFQSEDGNWTVTLQEEFFALETSAYTRWADFRARLASLTAAVADTLAPSIEQRVGLRFVDEVSEPRVGTPAGWTGLIHDAVLGPAAYPPFATAVRATQQVVELNGPNGTRVNLRHGSQPLPDGSGQVYLVDTDCFRHAGRAFDVEAIVVATDDLHTLAKQVFHATITEHLYSFLKGEG
jgi:uncharacterized protein (TIGR04255 family)